MNEPVITANQLHTKCVEFLVDYLDSHTYTEFKEMLEEDYNVYVEDYYSVKDAIEAAANIEVVNSFL